MTVTVSTPRSRQRPRPTQDLWFLLISLLLASLVVFTGILLFLQARSADFDQTRRDLSAGHVVDLNAISTAESLEPFLDAYRVPAHRTTAAHVIFDHVHRAGSVQGLGWLRSALGPLTRSLPPSDPDAGVNPAAALHDVFLVRTPSEFIQQLRISTLIYFAPFYVVAAIWWWRGFRGDMTLLTPLHLVTGMAFVTMLGLRNPTRDKLLFPNFAQGVALGTILLLLPAFPILDFRRIAAIARSDRGQRSLIYGPLVLIAALLACLKLFGSSPTHDANINLWGFQPVELIKVLVVVFYASYFSQHWGRLRDLREKRFGLPRVPFHLPKFKHLLPLLVATLGAVIVFRLLNDLGPALVVACLFLLLYAVALARPGLSIAGFVFVVLAFVAAGYNLLSPKLNIRVGMWLKPWENALPHGDQLARSFWGLATGGPFGSGVGWGDAWMIPTSHTDMIFSSMGEEWGFLGLLVIFMAYAWLGIRTFRIARRAPSEYSYFLAMGSGLLLLLQAIVIVGGVIGAIPLSGVPTPFLCWGRSSMVVNFLLVTLIVSVSSRQPAGEPIRQPFQASQSWVFGILLAIGIALVVRTAWIDVVDADTIVARPAHVAVENARRTGANRVMESPTFKQAPIYNPRIELVESQIPRGDIYDRNGILLATSLASHLGVQRAKLEHLGVSIKRCCDPVTGRVYPFRGLTYHIIGDNVEKARFGATDTGFVEKISNARLRGYESIKDILPAVHRRREPTNPALNQLLALNRDVYLTIDIPLQQSLERIVEEALSQAHKKAAAAIVVDVDSGAILASVNVPAPIDAHPEEPRDPRSVPAAERERTREELRPFEDVARFGAYPPGSTFKLVTAIAALRKNPELYSHPETCVRLDDGRAGARIRGYGRTIHDDFEDRPHGTLSMFDALRLSCNAYFAQLATYEVGADQLAETAAAFGIRMTAFHRGDSTDPEAPVRRLRRLLPDSGYGQAEVTASPLQMARVASAIANHGYLAPAHILAESGNDTGPVDQTILDSNEANLLARAMRAVVLSGTARSLAMSPIPIAGKTGTAQVDERAEGPPGDKIAHSWFAGFAPYEGQRRIAFAVLVEHGGYGGTVAASIAGKLVVAARQLGII